MTAALGASCKSNRNDSSRFEPRGRIPAADAETRTKFIWPRICILSSPPFVPFLEDVVFTRCWPLRRWACVCALTLMIPTRANAQSSTISGDLIAYSTIYSIGVEWDIANDADHDARVDVEYQASGSGAWLAASPLIRVRQRQSQHARRQCHVPAAGHVLSGSPDPVRSGWWRRCTRDYRSNAEAPGRADRARVSCHPRLGWRGGSLASPFRGV
jgi:hypothetical protein